MNSRIITMILVLVFTGCSRGTMKIHEPFKYPPGVYAFAVHTTDSLGNTIYVDTLGLLTSDQPMQGNNHLLMMWLTLGKRDDYEIKDAPGNHAYTGITAVDSLLFLHPPRDGRYEILQICPYPYFELPLVIGKQWSWELETGHANDAVKWEGDELFTSYYKVVEPEQMNIVDEQLPVQHIAATNKSRFGVSAADFLL